MPVFLFILLMCLSTVNAEEQNILQSDSTSNSFNTYNSEIGNNSNEFSENIVNSNNSSGNFMAAGSEDSYFNVDQIKDAASRVKNDVDNNYTLPENVTINGTTVNMAQFLELMMTATLQINSGNTNPIPLRTFNLPTNPVDDIRAGNIAISEYLKIANDLKTYMDSTGKTPDYQYQTSLGIHLGFQNCVYMFSFILYVNKVGNYLPNFVPMKPWSSIAGQTAGIIPNGPKFSLDQIRDAATTVKNNVESNCKLPDNVTINGTTINMAQFLELLTSATLQISSGNTNPIPLRTFNLPGNSVDDVRVGNIVISEYLKIANDLKGYMDSTGKTPDYQYQTSIGTHLGFQNCVYMFSFILYANKVGNYLPNFVPMKPWSSIVGQSAGLIDNGPKFSIDQISAAAVTVKNQVESNNNLPDNVTINGTTINMAQFLELLTTASLRINSGNTNPIPLRTFNLPGNSVDDIRAGVLSKSEYLKIANDLKGYMDSTGKTPDYQYQTSLGIHLGFQNCVYMYSIILYVYKTGNYLPDLVGIKSWSSIVSQSAGIIPNGPKFSIDQISAAAVTVKNQVESNNNLPDNVTLNG
ncbi:MAG: hypothetical protein ACXVHV_06030, partial [Methanobacterium sp.]